nr:hypothetical protein [Mesorhizobium sp.]
MPNTTLTIPATPTTAEEAIAFALDYLEPFEVADFLSDWRAARSLSGWSAGVAEEMAASGGTWTKGPRPHA